MPNGVTNFSSKIKDTESSGRYAERAYGAFDLASVVRANTTSGLVYTQQGDLVRFATGDGSSTSNVAGIAVTSGGPIDFLLRMPSNLDTAQAQYLDIYYFLTGAGTKGDAVQWAVTYNNCTPNATTTALATGDVTTGITDATRRVLATSKANGYMYRDTATIAANTFTANTLPHVTVTALGTYTSPELRVARIVHRFARNFL